MATRWMAVIAMGLLAVVSAAQDAPTLKTPKERHSYAVGMDIGNQLRKLSLELDPDLVSKAIKDALSGSKTLLTEEEVRANVAEVQAEMKRKQLLPSSVGMENSQKAAEAFLAENKRKIGVVTLPSGLQYRVLKAADGKKPTDADTVVCNYRGTLLDGTEFDSSYRTGQPATFAVGAVIPGWREALKLMAVGSKYQLFIPPELAYGARGSGPQIGPNATLIFEVELLAIK